MEEKCHFEDRYKLSVTVTFFADLIYDVIKIFYYEEMVTQSG
jgi:hypothetical protein